MSISIRTFTRSVLLAATLGLICGSPTQAADVTSGEARATTKEAYIYGFPMVDSYRIQYAFFVAKGMT